MKTAKISGAVPLEPPGGISWQVRHLQKMSGHINLSYFKHCMWLLSPTQDDLLEATLMDCCHLDKSKDGRKGKAISM